MGTAIATWLSLPRLHTEAGGEAAEDSDLRVLEAARHRLVTDLNIPLKIMSRSIFEKGQIISIRVNHTS